MDEQVPKAVDIITDIIPQTRLVKAIATAADNLTKGDKQAALNSLASGLTGSAGQAVKQVSRAVNTATALGQGNITGAMKAAGGTAATIARASSAAQDLAQGNVAGAVGSIADSPTAADVASTWLPTGKQPSSIQDQDTAQDNEQDTAQEPVSEVYRLKQLAGIGR